jgi:hypothetical protein
MGANAQTTVPTFTASQVLTADQQNQSARTGVPVFATTVTRDAAFGGTGEKTLAEGQLCYVEGTGLQTYNGTSWVTWGAAPSGGLTLVKTQTIGTGVSSVEVTGAFSSTYDAYKIIISGGAASGAAELRLTLGATATGYYRALHGNNWGGSAMEVAGGSNQAYAALGAATTNAIHFNAEILDPNLAKVTRYSASVINTITTNDLSNNAWASGFLNNTTQYTAFTLTTNTGTLTGGTIRVYGYQNS